MCTCTRGTVAMGAWDSDHAGTVGDTNPKDANRDHSPVELFVLFPVLHFGRFYYANDKILEASNFHLSLSAHRK